MRPILIDTDIGSDCDDALALGVALGCADALSLEAITTVSAHSDRRAVIAASLMGLAGRTDVDICVGERSGLVRPESRYNWFGHEDDAASEGQHAPISDEPAPERIVRAARETPGLEIAMIGPMTNLARALGLDPELPRRDVGLTIMGGHVREARIGSFVCPYGIDYNLCSDPEASVAVLGAGFRTTLITADVTLATWLRASDLASLESGSAFARELARHVRAWAPRQRKIFTAMGGELADDNVAFLHDPLTVLALADDSMLTLETLKIVPTIERGVMRTVEVDASHPVGAEMRVATGVDADRARAAIVERMLAA